MTRFRTLRHFPFVLLLAAFAWPSQAADPAWADPAKVDVAKQDAGK